MRQLLLLGVVSIVLILSGAVLLTTALDDQGEPNDPTVNPRANACYEDGSMAQQCQREIEWVAGWYLIRFEYGMISRDTFPDYLAWVLPPEPILIPPVLMSPAEPIVSTVVCSSLNFTCDLFFSCEEAEACRVAGSTVVDTDMDGIACNEAGNGISGGILCTP